MDIKEILEIKDTDKIIKTIQESNAYDYNPESRLSEYKGEHAILSRQDKIKKDEDGRSIGSVSVAKMVLQFQKKIVESAVAFLFGVPVKLEPSGKINEDAFGYIQKGLKNAKFDNQNRKLARALFIEGRAAKLYYLRYPQDPKRRKISSMVLSSENGEFYPNFNESADMDAFLRLYNKNILEDGKIKEVEAFELYTDETITIGQKQGKNWTKDVFTNPYSKIPVVYYEQEKSEWEDVKTLIERQELSLSQLIDTNEYFSSPIIKLFGKVSGMPDKSDQGKALQMEIKNDAEGRQIKSDAEYLTWDQRPESLQMQFDLIEKYIYSFSQTADLSFTNLLKNKPGNVSGVALKLLLLDPVLKSYNKQEIFEENLQREISVVKAMLGTLQTKYKNSLQEIDIEISFGSILPSNISEVIDYLSLATGGKPVMSQKTAIRKNPLVKNSNDETEQIKNEEQNEAGSFNL